LPFGGTLLLDVVPVQQVLDPVDGPRAELPRALTVQKLPGRLRKHRPTMRRAPGGGGFSIIGPFHFTIFSDGLSQAGSRVVEEMEFVGLPPTHLFKEFLS
jgi:hypothetical protein